MRLFSGVSLGSTRPNLGFLCAYLLLLPGVVVLPVPSDYVCSLDCVLLHEELLLQIARELERSETFVRHPARDDRRVVLHVMSL